MKTRRGQVIVMAAITLALLLAVAGLVLDGGLLYYEKRSMQSASDAAAVAGALEVWRQNTDYGSQVRPAALNDAGLNGYKADNSTITVNYPPLSGASAGSSRAVEVIIERNVPTSFMRVVNFNQVRVRTRSVAALVPYVDACIVALSRTAAQAVRIRGGSTIDANCGAISNSANTAGFQVEGDAVVQLTSAGVAGGFAQLGSSSSITPIPEEAVPPYVDPLGHLPPPAFAGWPAGYYEPSTRTYKCPGGQCVYNSLLEIAGPPGIKTFDPGIYVLRNGMDVKSSNVVSGDEVMFYNLGEGGFGIRIAGTSQVSLSPPTSGPYRGILFYADRNAPYFLNDIGRGTSNFTFRGVMYFPSQGLTMEGDNFTNGPWGMIIANTVDFAGNNNLLLNPPPADFGPDINKVMLVE